MFAGTLLYRVCAINKCLRDVDENILIFLVAKMRDNCPGTRYCLDSLCLQMKNVLFQRFVRVNNNCYSVVVIAETGARLDLVCVCVNRHVNLVAQTEIQAQGICTGNHGDCGISFA